MGPSRTHAFTSLAVASALFALFALSASRPALAGPPGDGQTAIVAGETAIESRLLAPCCWKGTLDAHESEMASALRAEIRQRLRAGEAPAAIEDDLVRRHGERMRAVDGAADTRGAIPILAGIVALLAGVGVLAWMRARVARAGKGRAAAATAPGAPDLWDERLDDELRRLDG